MDINETSNLKTYGAMLQKLLLLLFFIVQFCTFRQAHLILGAKLFLTTFSSLFYDYCDKPLQPVLYVCKWAMYPNQWQIKLNSFLPIPNVEYNCYTTCFVPLLPKLSASL